jgi:hypothetical protein
MATTDYDFTLTRDELIGQAYRKIGAIPQGATPSAAQITDAAKTLNRIVKTLSNRDVFLWGYETQAIDLVVGTASYALGTNSNVVGVEEAYYRKTETDGTRDTSLARISWLEYQALYDKAVSGEPQEIAFSILDSKAYLYPVPDIADKIFVVSQIRLKDWDTGAGAGDFPIRYYTALVYFLASELGEEYGIPRAESEAYLSKAETELVMAKNRDKRTSDACMMKGAFS